MQVGRIGVTLKAFLAARLDEDEAAARRLLDDPPSFGDYELLARRMLREAEAKRAILAEITEATSVSHRPWLLADRVLRHLAAVYSDHPDYDPAWGPG